MLRSAATADTTNAELLLALIDFELEHGSPGVIAVTYMCICVRSKQQRLSIHIVCRLNLLSKPLWQDVEKLFAVACGEEKDGATTLSGEALDGVRAF